jgi:hypothetical protein
MLQEQRVLIFEGEFSLSICTNSLGRFVGFGNSDDRKKASLKPGDWALKNWISLCFAAGTKAQCEEDPLNPLKT